MFITISELIGRVRNLIVSKQRTEKVYYNKVIQSNCTTSVRLHSREKIPYFCSKNKSNLQIYAISFSDKYSRWIILSPTYIEDFAANK